MEVVYVRMPRELIELLDLDSRIRGLKRSELIRKIVQDYYEDKTILSTKLKQALGLALEGRSLTEEDEFELSASGLGSGGTGPEAARPPVTTELGGRA